MNYEKKDVVAIMLQLCGNDEQITVDNISDEELATFNKMVELLAEQDVIGGLDDELKCGLRHARLLAGHVQRMGAAEGEWVVGQFVVKVVNHECP